MQGGTSAASTAGTSGFPSESKLASGSTESPTPKKPSNTRRTPNRVGRRYQLAAELITALPWLGRASRDRIAWVTRHVADAGWSATEVCAYLQQMPLGSDDTIRRPSGALARRLKGAVRLLATPAARRRCVEAMQASRAAEQQRHNRAHYENFGGDGPRTAVARREWDRAQALIRQRTTAMLPAVDETDLITTDKPGIDLESLTRAEVIDMRAAAAQDPDVIGLAIDLMGEDQARRLYTNTAVNRYLADQQTTHA
ncbi:hypothetical protein [Streptomyces sp. Ac-502]|uniref:hypothetical protein n=1 Tax=Streptomyces sp. Ac-502 TaxID=3342801 RepID=UPI00386289F3